MRTGFLAVTLLVWSSCSALAAPLDINTHTAAVPEQSFKLAATWFLPDWQAGMANRSAKAPSGSGDLNDSACGKTYNLNDSCTAPQIVENTFHFGKLICYKCKCPSNYDKTTCDTGWHLSGSPCKIGTVNYYSSCAVDSCPDGYEAGKTCGAGYNLIQSGQSGNQKCGKCVAKDCAEGYTAGLANCNGQSHPEGWTYTYNGYSGDKVCGKCSAKSCSSGTAGVADCSDKGHPEGWTYSSFGYAGNEICGTCTAKSCPPGYTAGVTQCSNTTNWNYGSNGYAGDSVCGKCSAASCASGFTAGLADCNNQTYPAGWEYSSTDKSGNEVCGKCTAKKCAAGTTSCASNQIGKANGYYAGNAPCLTCESACAKPVTPTATQVCEETCEGNCVKVRDMTCKEVIQSKYPSAKIVTNDNELWNAATYATEIIIMNDISSLNGDKDGDVLSFSDETTLRTFYQVANSNSDIKRVCGSSVPRYDGVTLYSTSGIEFESLTAEEITFDTTSVWVWGAVNCKWCSLKAANKMWMSGWAFLNDFTEIQTNHFVSVSQSDTNGIDNCDILKIKYLELLFEGDLSISNGGETCEIGYGSNKEPLAENPYNNFVQGATMIMNAGSNLSVDNAACDFAGSDSYINMWIGEHLSTNDPATIWLGNGAYINFSHIRVGMVPLNLEVYGNSKMVFFDGITNEIGEEIDIRIQDSSVRLQMLGAENNEDNCGVYGCDANFANTSIHLSNSKSKIMFSDTDYLTGARNHHYYIDMETDTFKDICDKPGNSCVP